MSKSVYERVMDWNAARYEQEFNRDLQFKLLTEEYNEFVEALNGTPHGVVSVEMLDALGDINFVAMGGIWKLGMDHDTVMAGAVAGSELADRWTNEIGGMEPIMMLPALAGTLQYAKAQSHYLLVAMAAISALCDLQLARYGFQPEQIEQVFFAICDSNDTKTVAKTASDVKANIDKGAGFVPPTEALARLLTEVLRHGAH